MLTIVVVVVVVSSDQQNTKKTNLLSFKDTLLWNVEKDSFIQEHTRLITSLLMSQ